MVQGQFSLAGGSGAAAAAAHQDLVKEVLDELLLKGSAGEQPVQVCAQEFGDEVNIWRGRVEAKPGDVSMTRKASPTEGFV